MHRVALTIAGCFAIHAVGCSNSNELPKIVANPEVHYDEPKDDAEWSVWESARKKATSRALIQSATVQLIDPDNQQLLEISPRQFQIASGVTYKLKLDFITDAAITSLPPTTNHLLFYDGLGDHRRLVNDRFLTIEHRGDSRFTATSELKLVGKGTYQLVADVVGQTAATISIVVP